MNHLGRLGVAWHIVIHNSIWTHRVNFSSNTSPAQVKVEFSASLWGSCVSTDLPVQESVVDVNVSVTTLRHQWRFDLCGDMTTSCHHLLGSKYMRTRGWTTSICIQLIQTQSCSKLSALLEGKLRCLCVSENLSDLCFSSGFVGWRTSCGTLSLAPQRPYLQPARNSTNA